MEREEELLADVRLLTGTLGDTLAEIDGAQMLERVESLRQAAIALRHGALPGGRTALAAHVGGLDLGSLERVASAFTQFFHLTNAAEEQHRIRTLRRRDRIDEPPEGSIAAACAELRRSGASADELRALLGRLFVMPVITAHPTEARRRTVLDQLSVISAALDQLDDRRFRGRERARIEDRVREAVMALHATLEARAQRPSPYDEVRAGLHVFERTLLDVTPSVYRELEDALDRYWPGEQLAVPPFLRWGTWIGGDRDGNPRVTWEVTRAALERQRRVAIARHLHEVDELGRELSVSVVRSRDHRAWDELEQSLEAERARRPELAALFARWAGEPLREKLRFMRARLEATRDRSDWCYERAEDYLADLELMARALTAGGFVRLARGRLRDSMRRAQVFGFHLATLDLRQHSSVHEQAVDELLARRGSPGYAALDEDGRIARLTALLERAEPVDVADRSSLSPPTRELLATLEVVGRARRDSGPEACRRYVISFAAAVSDVLEVLLLARTARLAPDELKPVPLLEQIEDLARAEPLARRLLELEPVRVAIGGELEVMIGYSDSSKQAGYLASAVALQRAQEGLARATDEAGVMLTVFHGRGGAVGRGGGPAARAILSQPAAALRGRFRVTEQGETITARYGRREIGRRDLEQMVGAVMVASGARREQPRDPERERLIDRAAEQARAAYQRLLADPDRIVRYALAATPLRAVAEMPIASRPAARGKQLSFADLRAIPWVFSWNQSRHGIPGWHGLGSGLESVVRAVGLPRARALYREWPFFAGLIDNAQLALARADIEVAACYAELADDDARRIFELIRDEHERTVSQVLAVTDQRKLLERWPTLARTVERRNPYVDVLNHAQIEALRREPDAEEVAQRHLRRILFITINGIAAGLMTAG
jgi:phosphoenolpyruvate carboxylase